MTRPYARAMGSALQRIKRVARRRMFPRLWRLSLMVPASRLYGFDRGKPVDRHYIEDFLRRHDDEICGRVLEVGDDRYTREFGSGITRSDVVDVDPANPQATYVGDLAEIRTLPADSFDCIVCTQVLMLVYDVHAALATLHRALAPGGVLLVTVAGITRVCRPEVDRGGDYWRFTSASLRRLLEQSFEPAEVAVASYGNVRSAAAGLYGLVVRDLRSAELELHDPDYEVIVAARARKRA
jgi:SAM-dependent methyltransferase